MLGSASSIICRIESRSDIIVFRSHGGYEMFRKSWHNITESSMVINDNVTSNIPRWQ